MSTTEDRSSAASSVAGRQGQGRWVSGLREGFAEIGDVRLHYVEAGDGPLIILLHGFPEFWYGWRLQIPPLAAAGFELLDRLGHPGGVLPVVGVQRRLARQLQMARSQPGP